MDRRERMNDPEEALRAALDGKQANIWTALPGIIVSFDPEASTVTVQPAIQGSVQAPDGQRRSVNMPVLPDVPVVFPGGGGMTLTFPIQAGDECLVVFSSRCIDGWWQSGGVQKAMESRMHDLSDGFALVGVRSQPQRLNPAVSAGTTQLRSDDGQTFIEMDAAGQVVKVKAPQKVVIDTPMLEVTGAMSVQNSQGAATACAFGGKIAAAGDVVAGTVSVQHHVHSNVQPGSGSSGQPVP